MNAITPIPLPDDTVKKIRELPQKARDFLHAPAGLYSSIENAVLTNRDKKTLEDSRDEFIAVLEAVIVVARNDGNELKLHGGG